MIYVQHHSYCKHIYNVEIDKQINKVKKIFTVTKIKPSNGFPPISACGGIQYLGAWAVVLPLTSHLIT